MQISRLPVIPLHPPGYEPWREPAARHPSPRARPDDAEPLFERAVADIQHAEQLFLRNGSRESFVPPLEDPRHRRALAIYQSVQEGQTRDYVSAMLGVDVYA